MSWEIGYDREWQRDIGYGVPSICDHPDCEAAIDRGLGYVCGREPYGGDRGCGLYFCGDHLSALGQLCERRRKGLMAFAPKPDTAEWINHKMTHESWAEWRDAQKAKP